MVKDRIMALHRTKMRQEDESHPADPEAGSDYPLVVFGDHQFCAGERLEVMRMRAPHMHSQIEINLILEGAMTYHFDGQAIKARQGQLILFWGMMPHQVCDVADPTRFVCLYAPFIPFLEIAGLDDIRRAILRGGIISAEHVTEWDQAMFMRWRDDLRTSDKKLHTIVHDEFTARLRRLAHEGWRDLRALALPMVPKDRFGAKRAMKAQAMIRFISENAAKNVSVNAVARAAKLHPNYAMMLFRQFVGLTIHQALHRHRLDMAQSLLISTDQPIASIAFETGFGSLSAFYAAFEKRFHATPREFRIKMQS